ncbi:MAG: hypothetical protein ACYDER_10820 [Ktedonobacteraceae bacterium]
MYHCIAIWRYGHGGISSGRRFCLARLGRWAEQPIDKGQFLALQSNLLVAMPDFSYNLSDVHTEGQGIEALIQIHGTNLGNLDLTMLDIAPVQATGLAVELSQIPVRFVTENDTLKEMAMATVAGGGLPGSLQQIGGELPVAPRLEEQIE